MTVQIRDSDGTVRLSGDLLASNGATGDVLTQQADGTYAAAPSGGSQSVACVVNASQLDLASGSTLFFTWDTIYDNLVDQNVLADLPDGIGIDPTSVGTDTLVTLEAGRWSFTLLGLEIAADATYDARIEFGNYGSAPVVNLPVVAAGLRQIPTLTQAVTLPAGAGFSVGLAGDHAPTGGTLVSGSPYLSIVRLA